MALYIRVQMTALQCDNFLVAITEANLAVVFFCFLSFHMKTMCIASQQVFKNSLKVFSNKPAEKDISVQNI